MATPDISGIAPFFRNVSAAAEREVPGSAVVRDHEVRVGGRDRGGRSPVRLDRITGIHVQRDDVGIDLRNLGEGDLAIGSDAGDLERRIGADDVADETPYDDTSRKSRVRGSAVRRMRSARNGSAPLRMDTRTRSLPR